jgi:zinc D-Ala-D-Ala carboxypeptidase
MKLSANFTLREMTVTNHRQHLEENYRVAVSDPLILGSLCAVATTMAQPIRDQFDAAVSVHSGFRYPALNTAVGGSSSSQHMVGEAVDFHVVGVDLRTVFEWIWKNATFTFGQLILEGYTAGQPAWIHLSLGAPWRPANRSGQVKVMDGGKWTTLDTGVRVN